MVKQPFQNLILYYQLFYSYQCIVCHQEDYAVGHKKGKDMVMGALVQKSNVITKNRSEYLEVTNEWEPILLPLDMHWGAFISSCGHAMHYTCWENFYKIVSNREFHRHLRRVK